MSGNFEESDFTTSNLLMQLTGDFAEPGEELDLPLAEESVSGGLVSFKEKAGESIAGKLNLDDPAMKKRLEEQLKRLNVPSSFLKIFTESSFRAYVQLIIDKIIEFLTNFGFFAGLPPGSAKEIKKVIEQTAYLDAKNYVAEEAKKIYRRKVRKKKFANKKDYETVGPDSKYNLPDFPARYDLGFINQFSEGLFKKESSNKAWGEWIENKTEKAGAIGPSQIMFFNFPEWMEDAGYSWEKYYDKMTKKQKEFWNKYENSKKPTYTSDPDGDFPETKNKPTYSTVGSIMAAILRDTGATTGQILKDMTFTKLEEYFNKFKDWGVVAGSWYCGPGYGGDPGREDCREYAESVLNNFISNLKQANQHIYILRKVSNFSNKLDEKKLFKEASIIDDGLFKFSS